MRGGGGRAVAGLVAGGIVCAGLGGCDSSVQRQRVEICSRAVPALTASEQEARILRAGSGPAPDTVRVDYAAGPRPHSIVCRFASGAELIGIATDGTALPGASVYLLKHYYLDVPDAAIGRGDR